MEQERENSGNTRVSSPLCARAHRRAEELIDRGYVGVKTDAVTNIRKTKGRHGPLPCSAENSVYMVTVIWIL